VREETIRDGSYPIARPLYLYLRADADHAARAWVDYALSAEGQAAVANSGFVPVQASSVSALADETPAQHVAAPAITRLYFAPNSASIEQASRALLLAAAAASHAGKRALVIGHADSVGKVETNERLARLRAETIAKMLRQHGWTADALEIEVAASTHPLASNTTADGRKANRRVDLMLLNR
jgi:outer membrane protein OmpA-like peptidoglycan-associated protein